ncbi:unnamed protein product [Acanthoscelides obtectus]|uniref:Uncharacterized protein n=1 Tax=Acanthoscelides obtectus TaxID=200917 RepID=A0A9P0MJA1_ACAOB|nr:unnamed protein product [Acanthoscelides obtectus]CAK1654905.1 hypothetical protein AOBTE_LOCUS18915 [Acanthoscelides obtectus]
MRSFHILKRYIATYICSLPREPGEAVEWAKERGLFPRAKMYNRHRIAMKLRFGGVAGRFYFPKSTSCPKVALSKRHFFEECRMPFPKVLVSFFYIHTDMWRAYKGLSAAGYVPKVVNYFLLVRHLLLTISPYF